MAHRIVKKPIRTHRQQLEHQKQKINYQQTQPNSYLNNNQLPRPIIPSVDSIYIHDKLSYKKQRTAFPPAQSLFISDNINNAGADFLRTTSALMLGNPKKTKFPFGAWITPFGSENVHSIIAKSPLRCNRCKTYINPYFRFNKPSAICNICGITFKINQNTDPANFDNPQLLKEGVIDFIVQDQRFMRKRLDIIKIFIVIQISRIMWEIGVLNTIIESIKAAIQNIQFEPNIRIGVIYFNSSGINYMKIRKTQDWKLKPPIKYSLNYSTTGLCCPLSDKQMLFDPNQEKQQLIYLLNHLAKTEKEHQKNSKYDGVFANYGSVLKSLLNSFENETGRVLLFSNKTPTNGLFSIQPRSNEDAKHPFKPLNNDFHDLAKQFVEAKVGIDMFLFTKQALISQQLTTVQQLASLTGGAIRFYSPFLTQNHGQNLYYEIYGCLERKYVYDVDLTARVSNGLNIINYGSFEGIRETRDVTLSMMDPATSITLTFQHQEKIQENSSAFLQYAMMFTNGHGQRRLRIINYRYSITNKISELHEACDYLTIANVPSIDIQIILRQAVSKMTKTQPIKIREDVINNIISIINQYVQQKGNVHRVSTLMVHPNLAPALAYIHSVIDGRLFLHPSKSTLDYRLYQKLRINRFNFGHFANYYYPKLFSLGLEIYQHEPIPGELIEGEDDIEQSVVLPPNLSLTHESLLNQGVFLHYSPDFILILVMPEAPQDLLIQIFGTDSWEDIEANGLLELQTAHNIRINIIIEELRRRNSKINGIYLPIVVKTPMQENKLNKLLNNVALEDTIEFRYSSFMMTITRHIQSKIK